MRARIYQPPKSAMQSGRAGTDEWVLEFEPNVATRPDPLMGWIGSTDTLSQVQLRFETREEATGFAQARAIPYVVELAQIRQVRPKAYAENFAYARREMWTH